MVWVLLIVLLVLLTAAVVWMNNRAKDTQADLDAAGIKSLGMFSRMQANVQRRQNDQSGPGSAGGPDRHDDIGHGSI